MTGPIRPKLNVIAALFALITVSVTALNQASLSDAPSVKLHVTSKRASLHIHGQSEFDVFANPVVSANGLRVLYDGYATFKEEGNTFTYSYTDGVGYLLTNDDKQNIQCIPSSTLPFHSILPALNDATPIPSASIGDEAVECSSGNLFKTTFAGVHFAICASGESGFTAFSSDFTIDVEYLENPVTIPTNREAKCDAVATPTSVTPTALALITGSLIPASTTRHLKTAEHMVMEASSCKCKSTPRPCIFFHGIGNSNEMEELQNTPKHAGGRMGNMNRHAPCCSTVKYAILNTMDTRWTNDTLQEKFCDRALRFSDISLAKAGKITDTVIITHSMAGLVMSMAIATDKCSFGEGSTWVALSSPMTGSMASDYFQDFCNDEISKIATDLLDILGQCPMPKARQSIMYQNGKYASKKLNAAYLKAQKAYRENVDAAMCSDNPKGVFSMYQSMMLLAASVIPHKSPQNDALVEFQSCSKGLGISKFGKSYKDTFYKPELNHADTVFLTSDGWLKDSQKPAKWFECLL
ncbi:hypothetical protein F442_16459 [Phytophthora nicotianae P10297]|uniref:AB hydrolase-1 domain-containing protein n=1 Tax=Phytophthora nicotianae P10297 TaxID=1317064 RepID=W2YK89_PHYNI|nr:hypothetical protein F442_16459 [Phytophthora nicotianae P10297]